MSETVIVGQRNSMIGQNILILGAHGMLGSDLVKVFNDKYLVSAWDKDDINITDHSATRQKIEARKFNLIINATGYTDVDGAEDNIEPAFALNGEAVRNLAEIAADNKIKLVHFSTEQVFDGIDQYGYNESSLPKPINVYGRSKLVGEKEVLKHKLGYVVRTSWLYGHNPQVGKPRGMNFVDTIIKLAQEKTEVKVVSDQFGKLTYTKDLAKAVLDLMESDKPAGIYHLVNEEKTSWYDVAKAALTFKKINTKVVGISSSQYPTKAKRPSNAVLLNTKFDKLRPWTEALNDYLFN